MSIRTALLIDVEIAYAAALSGWCARTGLRVLDFEAGALGEIEPRSVAVAVLGLGRGDDADLERVRALAKLLRGAPIVVLSRGLQAEFVFRLSQLGIADLIALPAAPLDLVARISAHAATSGGSSKLAALVGDSAAIRALRSEIESAARVESKVLLQGETGTGKSLVARMIHELSARRQGPFIHVDCAALSPTLIESELFGHEKGAFTGAAGLRRGRFELAAGGTIFLDEIGDLDAALQSKLLRVLEDLVFERVGGSQSLPMQARVVAATCHDLMRQVRNGRFRMDLYFRLNVIKLVVPALRERPDDVPALVRATSQRLCATLGIASATFSDSFHERMRAYAWPGNVRELVNVLERLLVQAGARRFEAEDLDGLLGESPESESSRDERSAPARVERALEFEPEDAAEAERIANALREAGGNVSRVSRRLDLPRGTLRHRMHKYGLDHLIQKD
ncbi:MAG: sigma-54 dependent transcriptional regulator [Myxococcota bacterium]